MSIKPYVTAEGRTRYRVDFRNKDGVRKRESFDTKTEAQTFNRDMKLLKTAGKASSADFTSQSNVVSIGSNSIKRKYLAEAIADYHVTISCRKKVDERNYFRVLFEYLSKETVGDEPIEYVDQIGLMHLQKLQTYLMSTSVHTSCFLPQRKKCRDEAVRIAKSDPDKSQALLALWPALRAPKMCEAMPQECKSAPLNPSTVNRYFHTYRDFFKQCEGWKHITMEGNPVRLLDDLPESNVSKKVHGVEITQVVISGLEQKDQHVEADVLHVMSECGPRPIEAQRQVWKDVDFERGAIRFWSKKGDGQMRERWLPMTPTLLEIYSQRHTIARRKFAAQDTVPVFTMKTGGRFDTKRFANRVRKVCDAAGIVEFVPYCLRYKVVTEIRENGYDTKTAGRAVGHTNIETTDGVYSKMKVNFLLAPMQAISDQNRIERRWTS